MSFQSFKNVNSKVTTSRSKDPTPPFALYIGWEVLREKTILEYQDVKTASVLVTTILRKPNCIFHLTDEVFYI